MNRRGIPDNPKIKAGRGRLSRGLSWVWMRGFLPAAFLLALAAASTMFRLFWQIDDVSPYRRVSVGDGGVIYCWETTSRWAYTSPSINSLGLHVTQNGQRINAMFDWHAWPPDFEEAARPLALVAGNVHVSLFYLPILAAVPAGVRMWYRHRKHRESWMCSKCRYDLRGLLSTSACPECGALRPPGIS